MKIFLDTRISGNKSIFLALEGALHWFSVREMFWEISKNLHENTFIRKGLSGLDLLK